MRIYNNLKIKNPTTGNFESVPAIFGGMPNQCAYNLLDNSYFVNPINQRGQTSYSGSGYTIDRWKLSAAEAQTMINDNGYISITNNKDSGRTGLTQPLEKNFIGKTLTVAIYDKDTETVYCKSEIVPEVDSSANQYFCSADFNGHSIRLSLNTSGTLAVDIMVAATKTANIKWAALYEGEYTPETLPPYIYKGYGVELAECQRYYKKFTAETTQNVSFAIGIARSATAIVAIVDVGNMRYSPDVASVNMSYTGSLKALGSNTLTGLTPTRDTYMQGGLVRLNFATSGATVGSTYLLASESNGFSIEFSSDL